MTIRKPITDYQRARRIVRDNMRRGANMCDDMHEWMPEDFLRYGDLTESECQTLYDLVQNWP